MIRVADIVLLGVKIERPDAMETLHVLSLVHLLLLCERCASDGVLTSAAADGSSLDATAAWDTSPTPSASQPPGVTQSSSDLALICPTSLPAPLQVSEADQVRRAKCRTICLSNYFSTGSKNSFIQSNYPGSPLWLIVPDSYLCSISTGQNRNLYNQVWECSNICSNFGSSRTCSSTCNSSCTAACPNSGVCSNYYPPSTQCRTRTCSSTLCNAGCSYVRDIGSQNLPSQYAPVGPPQLVRVSNQTNAYRVNITLAVPKPQRFTIGAFFNLVVRIQFKVGSTLNSAYYWLVSTENLLDLSPFSCQNISISFAVVNYQYSASSYSSPLFFLVPPPDAVTSSGSNVMTSLRLAASTFLQPVSTTSSVLLTLTSTDNITMATSETIVMTLPVPIATTSSEHVATATTEATVDTTSGSIAMATSEAAVVMTSSVPDATAFIISPSSSKCSVHSTTDCI
ncbi:hypothetical protein EMCRGX_G013640 [Ephydatia muelleri]